MNGSQRDNASKLARLARSPRTETADRFVLHLTLARATGPGNIAPTTVELAPVEVREVVLCRSVLKPSGAEQSSMASVELGG
ncbi:MAG: hypothetical protein AAGI53_09330 [Planctomycetota bacterium]